MREAVSLTRVEHQPVTSPDGMELHGRLWPAGWITVSTGWRGQALIYMSGAISTPRSTRAVRPSRPITWLAGTVTYGRLWAPE